MTNGHQPEPSFYIQKTLEYTVKGVEIVRAETIQLFNDRNSYLSWGSAAIGLLFSSAATSNYNYPFLTYIILLLVIPLLSCSLIIVALDINKQIIKISRYLRSREKLINLLLELTLASDKSPNNFLKSHQLYHLRKQLPIYWEHQFYTPTLDLKKNRPIKDINWQCHLTTWIFTIVALISYITGLCFKNVFDNNETLFKSDKVGDLRLIDINFFRDDFGLFSKYYANFFKEIFSSPLNSLFSKEWPDFMAFLGIIIIIIIIIFSLSIRFLKFILPEKLKSFIDKILKNISEWIVKFFYSIVEPYYIPLIALGVLILCLRFYLPIVIFIGIWGTFIYSNSCQIPKLTKIAQEPLSLDFTNILPDGLFPQEEENWSAIACVQMLLADREIYETYEGIPITQTLLSIMIGIPNQDDLSKDKIDDNYLERIVDKLNYFDLRNRPRLRWSSNINKNKNNNKWSSITQTASSSFMILIQREGKDKEYFIFVKKSEDKKFIIRDPFEIESLEATYEIDKIDNLRLKPISNTNKGVVYIWKEKAIYLTTIRRGCISLIAVLRVHS